MDILVDKFNSIDWNKFNHTELNFYTTPGGAPETKKVFCDLINEFCVPNLLRPIAPGQLLTIAGTTMVCDLLGQVLFDEGDVMLINSPYYHRFPNDFSDRGLIEISEVSSIKNGEIVICVDRFEAALQNATRQVRRKRGSGIF